ncbi:MAG: hypothetical protein ACKO34_07355, partial [Vampirovibrionales bacterium]
MEFWIVILVLAVGYLGVEQHKGHQRQRHLETQLKNLAYQFTTVKPSDTESAFASEATPPPKEASATLANAASSTTEALFESSQAPPLPASTPPPQPAYVVASLYKPTPTATSESAPTPSDATATFSTWLLRTGVALVTLGMAW